MARRFSMGGEFEPPERIVDDAAPEAFRQELVDLIFHISERNQGEQPTPDRVYRVGCQSLGEEVAGNPYGGYRYKVGRAIARADWRRVYDLILRFVPEFANADRAEEYRAGLNELLAAHGIVWDLGEDGRLVRVLPAAVNAQGAAAIQELSAARFAPALALFNSARDAYDDRPRRDRDACSNAFDALESVAKEKRGLPAATFGQVLAQIRQAGASHDDIVAVLERVNTLRNHHFGHGMAAPFGLTGPEVDFTYLACVAGILLFARMPY